MWENCCFDLLSSSVTIYLAISVKIIERFSWEPPSFAAYSSFPSQKMLDKFSALVCKVSQILFHKGNGFWFLLYESEWMRSIMKLDNRPFAILYTLTVLSRSYLTYTFKNTTFSITYIKLYWANFYIEK